MVDVARAELVVVRRTVVGRRAASGHRMGEWHHNARLSDHEVRMMRFLATSARALGLQKAGRGGFGGYKWLGGRFGCGASTARDVVTYRTRCDA